MPVVAWIRVTTVVAALLIVAGIAGCSSSDDAASDGASAPAGDASTTGPDPCSLLTVEQIDAATGWALPDGERPDEQLEGDRAVCNWEDLRLGATVQVQLDRGAGTAGFGRDRSHLERSGFDTPETVQIDGATDAVESADAGILTMLVGEDVVQLAVIGTDLEGAEQRVLAADVAEALR